MAQVDYNVYNIFEDDQMGYSTYIDFEAEMLDLSQILAEELERYLPVEVQVRKLIPYFK